MRKLYALLIAVAVIAGAFAFSFVFGHTRNTLVLYTADAYAAEASALLSHFHNVTGYSVAPPKAGGSFELAREIAQVGGTDLFLSVSSSSLTRQYLGNRSSGWALAIASDQLVIAYSRATEENQAALSAIHLFQKAYEENSTALYASAFENLTSGNVKVGISNASEDPAGLRAWLALEIAGYLYENNTQYFVQRAQESGAVVSSTSAAELVSPLEYGDIQFLFIYRSAAISKGLPYLQLPDSIGQGNVSLSSFYSQFQYRTSGGIMRGSPILLYLTVIAGSPFQSESYRFINITVQDITMLSVFGLQPLYPSLYYGPSTLPPSLSYMLKRGMIAYSGQLG